jgi:NAD(P)-dependent dehydrogenase (short-subunit alcohol dehydrogenase family)
MELANTVAVVTGGAQGLGEAICRTLGEAKAKVIVMDLRRDAAEALAKKLTEDGVNATALAVDVGHDTQVEEGIRRVMASFGRIDILVNNAAIDKTVSIEELRIQDWDGVLTTNLRGPFLLSKCVLPIMKQQRSGHIVNIVSTAAKRAWANASAYHASKWGLLGLSHALHVEARPHQVKVTAVVSGGMRTPFLLDRFPDIDISTLQDPRNVAETIRCILQLPSDTAVPEIMVMPMKETSWP